MQNLKEAVNNAIAKRTGEVSTTELTEDANTIELTEDANTIELTEDANTIELTEDANTIELTEDANTTELTDEVSVSTQVQGCTSHFLPESIDDFVADSGLGALAYSENSVFVVANTRNIATRPAQKTYPNPQAELVGKGETRCYR